MPSKTCTDEGRTMSNEKKSRKSLSVAERPVNAVAEYNALESPLLRLPAELRIKVWEYVFDQHFVHVEYSNAGSSAVYPKMGVNVDDWAAFASGKRWKENSRFRFYQCKSTMSELGAYQRFMDVSLDERLPGTNEAFNNNWRVGDRFHIEPCQTRHQDCCPSEKDKQPHWMGTPGLRQVKPIKAETHIDLCQTLSLGLLQTCYQIYTETKTLPCSTTTFGFQDIDSLLVFLFCLQPHQYASITSIWLFMLAGLGTHKSLTRSWNSGLFSPGILHRLQRLRQLHVSIAISHTGMGDTGPTRDEIDDPHLNSWVLGLTPLRGLPLANVTVIVADDPASKFGEEGYRGRFLQYGWNGDYQVWRQLREKECFTANEKRQWANRLKAMLLKRTLEI